jgi:hypothetical protein
LLNKSKNSLSFPISYYIESAQKIQPIDIKCLYGLFWYKIVHEKQATTRKNRAPMTRASSPKQLAVAEFDWPFETALDTYNRWVKLSDRIPWDELSESYCPGFDSDRGGP